MVKIIDVNNILKICPSVKNIMRTQSQRITADPVIVVALKKFKGLFFIRNVKTAFFKDLDLFFYCSEFFRSHVTQRKNRTPPSVHVKQRPGGEVA